MPEKFFNIYLVCKSTQRHNVEVLKVRASVTAKISIDGISLSLSSRLYLVAHELDIINQDHQAD